MDVGTCALAFRILRMNGYDVLSGTLSTSNKIQHMITLCICNILNPYMLFICYVDKLTQIAKEECYTNSIGGHLKDTSKALELYRASQIIIHSNESALEKQHSWSNRFLKHKLSYGSVQLDRYARIMFQEVFFAIYGVYTSSI